MKRSRPYSAVSVNTVDIDALIASRAGQKCVVGIDVAKRDFKAVLYWPDGSFQRPWNIKSPGEIGLAAQKLVALHKACPLTVAMESSGTYGDGFRQALHDRQIPLVRVSGKAVKDQSETFDGVPSQHDGKDAAIIAELCWRGKGKPWETPQSSEKDQELRYWVKKLDRCQKIKQVHCGRIEAMLARHWPEAADLLDGCTPTLAGALVRWGGPSPMAADPEASDRLAELGGHYLLPEKIAALVESARHTVGVRMNLWEMAEMKELAQALLDARGQIAQCRRELKRLTADHAVILAQTPAVGLMTACVLWMCQGDPRDYGSAAAYRKAMGLNLTECSSGDHQGQLRLSKRGQRLSRKWLYFAAMRSMQDPAVKRWTDRKKLRDGGKGMRAVIAVMRRLSLAAWHVAVHGVVFDAAQLFPSGAVAQRRS